MNVILTGRDRATRMLSLLLLGTRMTLNSAELLPNPRFETGTNSLPMGWRLQGRGAWTTNGTGGSGALQIEGSGSDSGFWRSEPLTLQPGGIYSLSFRARKDSGVTGGCAISGPSRVNRDFQLGEDWQSYTYAFTVPDDGPNDIIRLGQWEVKGRLHFDGVELFPAQAVNNRFTEAGQEIVELGEAESIENGVYRFQPNFGWAGANQHRPLWINRAGFNSDRWVFHPGAEVVYRFAVTGTLQTNARVRVNLNYHAGGALKLECGRDGTNWNLLATFDAKQRSAQVVIPASLFPADKMFVRMSASGADANLQVNTVDYEAGLNRAGPDRSGATRFVEVLQENPALAVTIDEIRAPSGRGPVLFSVTATNISRSRLTVAAMAQSGVSRPKPGEPERLDPSRQAQLRAMVSLSGPGDHPVVFTLSDLQGSRLFTGRTTVRSGFLQDSRPGYRVPGRRKTMVWWCESGWKLGLPHPPELNSDAPVKPLAVHCARGEAESAQLMLLPSKDGRLFRAQVLPLAQLGGAPSPIRLDLAEVAYLNVTHPTDASSERGRYPDPLPPLKLPLDLKRGARNPLWLTFHVPREAKAGDHAGELQLTIDDEIVRVPLSVHVYDFELPRETHLRSAFGLGTHAINQYHRLTNRADQAEVFEKYLQNFAEHRISPYSFFDHAPIDVRFAGDGTSRRAQVDFTRFDAAAAKWLDDRKFNSFMLPLRGMGGGTFHSRHLGELEGFKEGTPEHARLFGDYLGQIVDHLNAKGWLDRAYTYWFDEPDPKDYAFVVDGMKRIRAAAPGLRRMLTEQPEKELLGHVEIWCGLTPEWTREAVQARRKAGEEVWWYVCTGPKAPYLTLFIDHPGTEMRLWPWQSWQYGVQGILVWQTTYWTSPSAFPPPRLQDPWKDPMGYVSGYDFGAGQVGYWGNGDGRFVYPPRRDPSQDTGPNLDGPVNSIRWENLRDGMEDYEYFWLLDQEVRRLESANIIPLRLIEEARGLLMVPEEISKDLTHFTTDPRLLLAHRDRLARMIERLGKLR